MSELASKCFNKDTSIKKALKSASAKPSNSLPDHAKEFLLEYFTSTMVTDDGLKTSPAKLYETMDIQLKSYLDLNKENNSNIQNVINSKLHLKRILDSTGKLDKSLSAKKQKIESTASEMQQQILAGKNMRKKNEKIVKILEEKENLCKQFSKPARVNAKLWELQQKTVALHARWVETTEKLKAENNDNKVDGNNEVNNGRAEFNLKLRKNAVKICRGPKGAIG